MQIAPRLRVKSGVSRLPTTHPETEGTRDSYPLAPRMRVALFSSPAWLCLAIVPAPSASTASRNSPSTASTRFQTSGRGGPPTSTGALARSAAGAPGRGGEEEEMASTALDFREMMRKERELAMKKLATETATPAARCCTCRRSRRPARPRCTFARMYARGWSTRFACM